jgi:hypothetical protein
MERAIDRSSNGPAGLDHIGDIISACWNRRTSYEPERWSRSNRAWGQCAVTALVVQDLFGGVVLRGFVNGIEHYWNRLPNQIEVDLTRVQFPSIHEIAQVSPVSRESILASAETARRYEALRRRVVGKVTASPDNFIFAKQPVRQVAS